MRFFAFLLGIMLIFSSCQKAVQIPSVEREDLFTLDIGRLEDQIALYNLEGDRGIRRTDMAMRDGLFYISDGNGAKILHYNSYGDLLFMIHNEETNPPPLSLKPLKPDSVVTRWATTYPLQEPGEIAVDSRKHIYVRDRLPYERHSFDPESKALLDSTILHFDENGNFVEYLGRDGIGGSPFPRIEGLYVSIRDELAVVCRLPTGWNIYWFESNGHFLFMVQLKNELVPVPKDRDMVIPSLDSISAAPDSRKLYIKVDYYRDTYDESTNTRTGNEPDSSVIWIMNAEDGSWERTVEIPFFEYTYTENNRRFTTRMPYSMLGVIQGGRIFFSFPVEGGYSLLILSANSGGEQRQGFIQVNNDELQFNVFDLSAEGILSGLLVDDWNVKLVWWRTDKFIGEG
ncbi:LIC_12708 family protein [Leadbettera azotonutricia]|uniref:Putative lipoprotein n=1 Tax=Leadbettera azotonutricia (strain ATCC BAA-888 / DSM 13862 / ZAS-9) TaxID=545695 RepID=F5YAY4_LEAAZ|nr:hypothetical protein [Leadbettera azotonutricia]AEF83419.1 putative lipoprotein [Leadbettera azotonutricia ZAS-9]